MTSRKKKDYMTPIVKYNPDHLVITFNLQYHWKMKTDDNYFSRIIPQFVNKKYVNIEDNSVWDQGFGHICIYNINKIAEENKLSIDSIGETIKKNLMNNRETPPIINRFSEDIMCWGVIFAITFGIASVIAICSKFNIHF